MIAEMLIARTAKPRSHNVESAWYYLNRASMDVYVHSKDGTVSCRLTRKQLERALQIMDKAAKS